MAASASAHPAGSEEFGAVRQAMLRLLDLVDVTAASRVAAGAGSRLHYVEVEAAGSPSGPPLLLLHGGGGGAANWFRLLPRLSARRRLLAPDLPGFGLSPAVVGRPPLGRYAAHILLDWLARIGVPRVDVLGTSFGGLAALRMAQLAPDRVRRVIALDSAGFGREAPLLLRIGTLRVLRRAVETSSRAGQRFLLRTLLTSDRSDLPRSLEDALVDYLHCSAAAQPAALPAALAGFADWRGQREVLTAAELRVFPRPLLIAWGEADRFFRIDQARRAAREARSELRVFRRAGHSPNWERPAGLLDGVLPFLEAPETA